jgi:hypothetical protein
MSTNSPGSSTSTAIRRASAFGMEIVGLDEIKRLNPFLTTDNVIAAAWTTDDGTATRRAVQCAGQGARDLGATVVRHNRVLDIKPRARRRVGSGHRERAPSSPEMVVNAAGCYARQVAAMVGADAPITNMQHHYVVTHPIPAFMERSEEIPVMRDSYTSGLFPAGAEIRLDGVYETRAARSLGAARGSGMGILERTVPRRSGAHRALARARHRAHADFRRGGHPPRHQRRDSAHARRRAAARARRRACAISGCAAAPRSASRKAAAAASIWRNGCCTATPRSTWRNSIRGASAPLPTRPTCATRCSRITG